MSLYCHGSDTHPSSTGDPVGYASDNTFHAQSLRVCEIPPRHQAALISSRSPSVGAAGCTRLCCSNLVVALVVVEKNATRVPLGGTHCFSMTRANRHSAFLNPPSPSWPSPVAMGATLLSYYKQMTYIAWRAARITPDVYRVEENHDSERETLSRPSAGRAGWRGGRLSLRRIPNASVAPSLFDRPVPR